MAVVFRLRGFDGKYIKGDVKNVELTLESFGSTVVQEGRKILNQPGVDAHNKRTKKDTLFSQYHYTMQSTKSTIKMGFEFGAASDYWQFVDQGVRGTGKAQKGKTKKGRFGARGGTGLARGVGSPFQFKYDSPGGAMVNAITKWIGNKPISLRDSSINSAAWAIGYSIKRRGLERTMFFTRPIENYFKTVPTNLKEAFKLDFGKLINKLPNKVIIIE